MSENKPVVIWIENKRERDIYGKLSRWLKDNGKELHQVKDVNRLSDKLDEIKNPSNIHGFIVDMMLDGPNTLSSFGLPEVIWNHDVKDAGEILLEYILKKEGSPYIEVPTLLLSVRPDLDSENLIKKYNNTQQIIKRDIVNQSWLKELKQWIDQL